MSDKFQCHITINNRMASPLQPQVPAQLTWGTFLQKTLIGMKTTGIAFVATGKRWRPGGTEGTVVYQVGDDPSQTIKVSFDVPATPGKSNIVDATAAEGLSAKVEGLIGKGLSEACTVTVRNAS